MTKECILNWNWNFILHKNNKKKMMIEGNTAV